MRRIGGVAMVLVMAAGLAVAMPSPPAEAYKSSWYLVWQDTQLTGSGCGWLGCYIKYRVERGYGQDRGASVSEREIIVGVHARARYSWSWKETRSRIDRRNCTSFTSGANAGKQYCGDWVRGTAGPWVVQRNHISVEGALDFVDGSGIQTVEVGACKKLDFVTSAFAWRRCTHRAIKPGTTKTLAITVLGDLETASGVRYTYGGTSSVARPAP